MVLHSALYSVENAATALFESRLVKRPYCCDHPADGVYRLPVAAALSKRLIQANSARLTSALCFDIDRRCAALAWMDSSATPPPNISLMNPANGHVHLIYLLENPVSNSNISKLKPLMYLAAIQYALREALNADKGYSGLLVKNPRHPDWVYTSFRQKPYSLFELSEKLDLPAPAKIRQISRTPDYTDLGRNATMFEVVRRSSYSIIREHWKPNGEKPFLLAVIEQCRALNLTFAESLSEKEVLHIACSISRWVWRRFSPAKFRESQAKQGQKGGRARGAAKREACLAQAVAMHKTGNSQRQIAKCLGVTQKTVSNWLKRG